MRLVEACDIILLISVSNNNKTSLASSQPNGGTGAHSSSLAALVADKRAGLAHTERTAGTGR